MELTFLTRDRNVLNAIKNIIPIVSVDRYKLKTSADGKINTTSSTNKYKYRYSDLQVMSLADLNYDIVISPANSFGELKGGFDMQYYLHLGKEDLQKYIYNTIATKYYGEVLVGNSAIINLHKMQKKIFGVLKYDKPKYMLICPTMTIPTNVAGSRNAYLFTRAVLEGISLIKKIDNGVNSALLPVPCVGVGGMPAKTAANQIKAAFETWTGKGKIYAIYGYELEKFHEYQPNSVLQNAKMMYIQMIQGTG